MPSPGQNELSNSDEKSGLPIKAPKNSRWFGDVNPGYAGISSSAVPRYSPTLTKYPPLSTIAEQKDELLIED
jgi:hypothetical protein